MGFTKISNKEYERIKRSNKIDFELFEQFRKSLQDVKEGRIRRVT